MKVIRWLILFVVVPSIAYAGLTEKQRKTEFEKAFSLIISTATPQLSTADRDTIVRDYLDAKLHKAQTIEPTSKGSYWRSTQHESQDVTGDRALEACELHYGKPCALIAVDEEISSEGKLVALEMPRLKYAGKFDPKQVPIIRIALRKSPIILQYDLSMGEKAMAIHPQGRIFVAVGHPTAREAAETALAKCNNDRSRSGKDGPCFLYAINNDVVISKRLFKAE
jgi:hypothetical protein